ncbi:cyclin-dependent protein kinase inhibitor SMR11 isoform X2 [Euphorbia lathyris]|uniref:cyclin-dependent protein kinase inhibitor SMR11 isoform X2 n=1 Tax=Euphorbia lathyris TaxID=212925 RepID=UPI00331373C6
MAVSRSPADSESCSTLLLLILTGVMGDMESELLGLKSLENSDTSVCGPTTPDTEKENGDFPLDLTSPLTVAKKLPKVVIFGSETNKKGDSSSPKTPKDGVFDPFAPGPDDKAWAPQGKKYFDEARMSVARRLTFSTSLKGFSCPTPSDDAQSLSDEKMLESVYENLLEVIVSNQAESVLAQLSNAERDFGAWETPPSAPRLNGVAETCPGAPLKPTGETLYRNC